MTTQFRAKMPCLLSLPTSVSNILESTTQTLTQINHKNVLATQNSTLYQQVPSQVINGIREFVKCSVKSGARCSSVVRVFAHGAMGRWIDPSWVGPSELFLVYASAQRLV